MGTHITWERCRISLTQSQSFLLLLQVSGATKNEETSSFHSARVLTCCMQGHKKANIHERFQDSRSRPTCCSRVSTANKKLDRNLSNLENIFVSVLCYSQYNWLFCPFLKSKVYCDDWMFFFLSGSLTGHTYIWKANRRLLKKSTATYQKSHRFRWATWLRQLKLMAVFVTPPNFGSEPKCAEDHAWLYLLCSNTIRCIWL